MDPKKINVKTENLAVPEIIVDNEEPEFDDENNQDNNIDYDNLAIPEIKGFSKKKK